jgi:hypothetical protein
MDALAAFGLFAVTAMLICWKIEATGSPWRSLDRVRSVLPARVRRRSLCIRMIRLISRTANCVAARASAILRAACDKSTRRANHF